MGKLSDESHRGYLDGSLRPLLFNRKKIFGPHVKNGMRVLDAGCGAGFNSIGLAELVGKDGEVVAADVNARALDVVEKKANQAGMGGIVKTVNCSEDSLCVSGEFDFVAGWWMVHETAGEEAFVREVYGILKPGGRFFIAEPKFHVKVKDFKRTLDAAGEAGFRVVARPGVFMSMAAVLEK